MAQYPAQPFQRRCTKLVEHTLTTFLNFPEETLADMWLTKFRVLVDAYASDGGNEYKLPHSN